MRVQIHHGTVYRYDPPATGAIQLLRLTPRDYDGQHVVRWRIDLSADARLTAHEDALGNITHVFSATGPLAELRVDVDGEVETQNSHGVVSGAIERFPPRLFLRPTPLTAADEAIRDFAERARGGCAGDALAQVHALLEGLHREVVFDVEMTDVVPSASEAFALKRGVCRDLCHIFIAAGIISTFRRATSPAICRWRMDGSIRRPATPGRKLLSLTSAGWGSIQPTAFARPKLMCASRSDSIRSARRRCAACVSASAAKILKSRSKSGSDRVFSAASAGGAPAKRATAHGRRPRLQQRARALAYSVPLQAAGTSR